MPYNTRRKPLSLPSLGIHVPVSHAARAAAAANRMSPSTNSSPRAMVSPSPSTGFSKDELRPSKKLKRAHNDDEDDEDAILRAPHAKRRDNDAKYTPPPSPPASRASVEMEDVAGGGPSIDLEGINDEIVESTILLLQETDNRPLMVKELAAALMQHLKIVQHSANASAIVSSRLTTFLKRPCWSARLPCPLGKELEETHPRRTYFYLADRPRSPRLPLAENTNSVSANQFIQTRSIITPSLSSGASGSEDAELDRRRELSPSPEVDLSSPEFDDMDDDITMPSTPIGSLSIRGFAAATAYLRTYGSGAGRHHRAASPPLEKDEKEFTQTADGLQKRKLSGELLSVSPMLEHQISATDLELSSKDDSALFGDKALSQNACGTMQVPIPCVTSPAMRPSLSLNLGRKESEADSWAKLDLMLDWDRSPETVELDELDCLLSGY